MFKHYFEQMEGVEIWPIISLIIFFTFFIGLIIYVAKSDATWIKKMSKMPLNDGYSEQGPNSNDFRKEKQNIK